MLKILRSDINKIHSEITTGPVDFDCSDEESLRKSIVRNLNEARKRRVKSIAIPLMPLDVEEYAREEGMRIAVDEINQFLKVNNLDITLVVPGERYSELDYKLMGKLKYYVYEYYNQLRSEVNFPAGYSNSSADIVTSLDSMKATKPLDPRRSLFGKSRLSARTVAADNDKFADDLAEYSLNSLPNNDDDENSTELERKLADRIAHRSDSFTQYLLYLIDSKNLSNSDVYKRALVTKQVFSSMKNDIDYRPTKSTALRLCVGAMLNLDESKDLLARAGYALSPCDKADIIFSFFIENEHYDLIDIDIQLEEYGLPCIIS